MPFVAKPCTVIINIKPVCVCVCPCVEVCGRATCCHMVISGGDDGALAAHLVELSIKSCVVLARSKQTLAHAAQITGPHLTNFRLSLLLSLLPLQFFVTKLSMSSLATLALHDCLQAWPW